MQSPATYYLRLTTYDLLLTTYNKPALVSCCMWGCVYPLQLRKGEGDVLEVSVTVTGCGGMGWDEIGG